MPVKLDKPLNMEKSERLSTLPKANSRRFNGVTNKVAIVPRSFSPAMDGGAMDMQPMNATISSSIGISLLKRLPTTSSLEARSNTADSSSEALMSKRLQYMFS